MTYFIVIGEHPHTGEVVWEVSDKMLISPEDAVKYTNMDDFDNLVAFPLRSGPDDELVRYDLE